MMELVVERRKEGEEEEQVITERYSQRDNNSRYD